MGAPQRHGQRSYKSSIATHDTAYARSLGDTSDFSLNTDEGILNQGIRYNQHWGHLDRWTLDINGDTIHNREKLNARQNYYHKPQFSLRHFWTVNNKFYVSNILYMSIGKGGGTSDESISLPNGDRGLQFIYDNVFSSPFSIDPAFSLSERKNNSYLTSSINNHYWYGALSTLNYQATDKLSLAGGIDMRYYKGEHYREIYDLLGGDYATVTAATNNDNTLPLYLVKREGDIIDYQYDGLVKWSGVFAQAEYSNGVLSTFLNISGSNSAYQRIDYFKNKDLILSDTIIMGAIGPLDTLTLNGINYTINSPEAKNSVTEWKWIRGYTAKSGANLNLNEHNNIFFNLGYISKAPIFDNVYTRNNTLQEYIRNEIVKAVEGGYSYRSSLYSANLNMYYTVWENKPANISDIIDNERYSDVVPMNALHKGVEMDGVLKLSRSLSIEGLVSLGDWIWTSEGEAIILNSENNPPSMEAIDNTSLDTLRYDANGVHVGDAAQTQFGFSIRYEPSYNSYIKLRGTYFTDHYADFDAASLKGDNAGRESWKMPAYKLIDLHAGYKFKLSKRNKLDVKLSILNLFNTIYISDARNNDSYVSPSLNDFDAKSASVFFGLGRRINLSAKFTF